MTAKDYVLEFSALALQAVSGRDFLHYGYWENGNPEIPTLTSLCEAQQVYFERMRALIPQDVSSILEVGSGTGSNARVLAKEGFSLECICPSAHLNELAKAKLPDEISIHETLFEDFVSDKRFDLLLFPESFHYMRLREALEQAVKYTDKYVLIFDYFRKQDSSSENSPHSSYRQFNSAMEEVAGLKIVSDEDVTEKIAPTFFVLDHVLNEFAAPFAANVKAHLEQDHWFYNKLFNVFLGKPYRKLQVTSRGFESFSAENEYRLILLEKSS